jgi:hypothetical protein
MKWTRTIWFLIFISSTKLCFSQEEETKQPKIEFRGYLKDLQGISFKNNLDSLNSVNLLHNRINFNFNFSSKISARLEIRSRVFWGDQVKQIPGFGKMINQYNGFVNLSHLWVNTSNFVVHSVIDRMLFQYQTEKWDIKIGRQRINWGINTIWNPNDIFNAYNFLDFDYEERSGNDAVRVQHYLKNNSTLELAYKPGRHKNETIAGALYKFNKEKYDWQMLGGIFNHDIVLGGGWAGNIKKAGFKGELSYFHPQKSFSDTSGVLSFSVMADQTFKNDWYFSIAALFNSNPTGMQNPVAGIYSSNLSAKELFPYRYTFYTGVMKAINLISSFNFSVIYSPERNTLIFFPNYSWNAAKNLDLDMTIQSSFAKDNGRYSTQGTAIFIRGKWSF